MRSIFHFSLQRHFTRTGVIISICESIYSKKVPSVTSHNLSNSKRKIQKKKEEEEGEEEEEEEKAKTNAYRFHDPPSTVNLHWVTRSFVLSNDRPI